MGRFLAFVDELGRILPTEPLRMARHKGKTVWVSIHQEAAEQTRTNQSNRYLWSQVYGTIAFETGNDPQTVHEALKREAVRVGVLEPHYVLIGDQLFESDPTTVVEQEQFSRYVSWIKEGCATGKLVGQVVVIPDPLEA